MNPVLEDLPPARNVRSIACFAINGVGDTICMSPAFAALRARYPDARLSVIVRPHLAALVDGSPFVDESLFFDTSSARRVLALAWTLRRHRFDLWVDLHVPTYNTVRSNSRDFFRNALFLLAAGARYRAGYAVSFLKPFLSHGLPQPSPREMRDVSVTETTLALAGTRDLARYPKFVPVASADRQWAQAVLPPLDVPRIALFFGSRQQADLWPLESIHEFIDALAARLERLELVLIGGAYEQQLARQLLHVATRHTGLSVRNFIDRASLPQTAALLERCNLFVTTDSGPLHIADAVGTPMVALFSSKNLPALWRPLHATTTLLNRPVECGPCFRSVCPHDNRCMRAITPHDALEAVVDLLGRIAGPTIPAA